MNAGALKCSVLRLPLTARSGALAGLTCQRRRWTKKLPQVLPGSGHLPGPARSSKGGNLPIQLPAINRQGVEAEDGEGGRGHRIHGCIS